MNLLTYLVILYILQLILGANQFIILSSYSFYHNIVTFLALLMFYALKYFICHTSFLLLNICRYIFPSIYFQFLYVLMFWLCLVKSYGFWLIIQPESIF